MRKRKKKYIESLLDDNIQILDINALQDKVLDLKWYYFELYHQEPKYIKMPLWVTIVLERYSRQLIGYCYIPSNDNGKIRTYMGLMVWETNSISSIHEIEVF